MLLLELTLGFEDCLENSVLLLLIGTVAAVAGRGLLLVTVSGGLLLAQ